MANTPLRIVFAGTPDFAAQHLKALLKSTHQVVAVYTQPDRPAGRGKKLHASPVKQLAESSTVPVLQPATLRGDIEVAQLSALKPDVLVVVAYGLILPQAILDVPRLGCLNVHGSLLPRWRGAAPIQRAVEAGDKQSGVTIMQMDAGLDTGAMLATAKCPIGSTTTSTSLLDDLAGLGAPLLLKVLNDLPAHLSRAVSQQDSEATYANKILKSEAEVSWQQSAVTIERSVRAFNPFPISFTTVGEQRFKIWEARVVSCPDHQQTPGTIAAASREGIVVWCGQDQLNITKAQLPGGKVLSVDQILSAKSEQFAPGVRLGIR
ncbi:MAG: methionyl-tRNA formyltransferase [Halioglobus sp.]|jgi:methionyl-tRNA formyltransferase